MSWFAQSFRLVISIGLALILALLGLETLGINLLGWLLLLIGVFYAAGVVIVYWVLKEPVPTTAAADKLAAKVTIDWSFWLVLPGILATFLAPPLEVLYLSATLPRSLLMQAVGIILVLLGSAIFVWAQAVIPRPFRGPAGVREAKELIRTGPYHLIRHPGYAGCILVALGISLGYSSLNGLLAIPILLLPGLICRIHQVEKQQARDFGEQFRRYTTGTARLIPGIW